MLPKHASYQVGRYPEELGQRESDPRKQLQRLPSCHWTMPQKKCPRGDSNSHCTDLKSVASCRLGYTDVSARGLEPPLRCYKPAASANWATRILGTRDGSCTRTVSGLNGAPPAIGLPWRSRGRQSRTALVNLMRIASLQALPRKQGSGSRGRVAPAWTRL